MNIEQQKLWELKEWEQIYLNLRLLALKRYELTKDESWLRKAEEHEKSWEKIKINIQKI